MNNKAEIAVGVILIAALAATGGYWLGNAKPQPQTDVQGKTDTGKKILYYRNPMGLADTSPVPKKDSMGMDYIAVYAGTAEEAATPANQIKISTQKVQMLGVRSEAAQLRSLDKTVRVAGRVEADERHLFTIAPKFEGYVERLHVSVTGQPVTKGQPLFEVYSPELVSAQREYAIAAQGVIELKDGNSPAQSGMQQLVQSSLLRLKNWDISDEQIKALTLSGSPQRTLTFRSPATGIVMEKKAVQGMRFMAGEMLYQVADLSHVWVLADVFEQDLGLIKIGAKAQVRINAYPDKTYLGTVTYVYHTLKTETRTVPVRVELANPELKLKPGMFAQVEMQVAARAQGVTVPLSAVIDSGTRQIVLLQLGAGLYEPREVKLGARSDTYVEILDGVKAGDLVVVAANFLIDAESNLKAAVGGFAGAAPVPAPSNAKGKAVSHEAVGSVDSVDAKALTVNLNHGPIASLKWPAMTMEFKVANEALLEGLKPGVKVTAEFIERQPGEWVITSIKK